MLSASEASRFVVSGLRGTSGCGPQHDNTANHSFISVHPSPICVHLWCVPLLADTELAEDGLQQVFGCRFARDLAQGVDGGGEVDGDEVGRQFLVGVRLGGSSAWSASPRLASRTTRV